jgi:hypothetical protein
MTYVDLRGADTRPVRVHVDDQWREGQLEAYRRDRDGTWRGFPSVVSEGVGMTRLGPGQMSRTALASPQVSRLIVGEVEGATSPSGFHRA